MIRHFMLAALGLGLATATPALSQGNLEKLSSFKATGTAMMEPIPQEGKRADSIREILKKIEMPAGFEIDLYALVPDARHIAVGPDVKRFAPSIDFTIPNGVCFSKDGFLYIVEQNRILLFPAAEFFYEGPDVAAFNVVAQGELIPEDEESYNHTARVCDIGPDDKLYVSLGQPFNVAPKEKLDLYKETGIGGILRMDRDGKNREVYTYGVRNSVGQDFHPETGELWWTDNQVDGMGDDIPPGELNRQTKAGQHFGHPWYGGGKTRTNEYKGEKVPVDVVHPVVETVAHAADLGMMFYTGKQFPAKYKNGIFSAQHGSWNRTEPVGARVMFTSISKDGKATMVPFAEGWLDEDTGEYLGRPVDVAQLRDGSILVSDDLVGAIYRISYSE